MLLVGTPTAEAQTQLQPIDSFQATCNADISDGRGFCSGGFSDGSFGFFGPFAAVSGSGLNQFAPGEGLPSIEFSIGTSGGVFTYNGNSCNYDDILGGISCSGEVLLASGISPPDDRGVSPGAVVSVVGQGSMEGFFCEPCSGRPPQVATANVAATYQFVLTAPGTPTPWSWTGAEFSSQLAPTPEPSTLLLFGSGLLLFGIILCRRQLHTRRIGLIDVV